MKTWLPFYVGDYLSDTLGLTVEEHGAYFLLILAYWKNRGPLEQKKVDSILTTCGNGTQTRIQEFFDLESTPGFWVQKRVETELKIARQNHESAVRKGKLGAAVRYGKKKK